MPEKLKKGWTQVAFGDVVRQVRDRVEPEETGLDRYVAGEHMDTDDLKIRRWGNIGDGYLGPAFHMRFKPGHVLYGSRRTYLRKVAVADFEGITANTTFVMEPKDPNVLLPELLPFIMQTKSFHDHSIKQSKGSVNPYINYTDLMWYEFALPPLEEQRRIAEVLGGVQHLAEAYHYVTNRSANVLAATSHARFSRLSKQPYGTLRPLGELLQKPIANGIFRTRDQFGSGMKLVNVTDCYKGFRVPVGTLERVPVSESEYESFSALPGDVIFNRSSLVEAGIGHACLIPATKESLVFECHLMRVRPNPVALMGPYLARYALSPMGRRYLLARAQTTTMTTIGQSDLVAMPVPCTNIETQGRVVDELDSIERSGELALQRLGEICALKEQLLRSLWAPNGGDYEST